MEATSEAQSPLKSHRSMALAWLTGISIFMVLYVLSIGPAFRLCMSGYISMDAFNGVYAPITSIMGRVIPVREFFEWYLRQWDFKILRGEVGVGAPPTYSP